LPSDIGGVAGPLTLLLGSIHCHSTLSDGSGTPEEILDAAAFVGLDFVAITDHVPASVGDLPNLPGSAAESSSRSRVVNTVNTTATPAAVVSPAPRLPAARGGVVRLPGLEYSAPGGHYLVLGLDPGEAPAPSEIDGWPDPRSCVTALSRARGALGFIAHPDDTGNPFLKVDAYAWTAWDVEGFTGLELWNLSTDWSRHIRGWGDVISAWTAGLYRAVPPPAPVTLARWDGLARSRNVAAIAGTDAHAYPVRKHGLRFRIFPYDRAFRTLQTAVWIDRKAARGPVETRAAAILDAVGRGRSFLVNRAWGHPLGFSFEAEGLGSAGSVYLPGDTIEPDREVRFRVSLPAPSWIRLVRNGQVVANTFGRELLFEPLAEGLESRDEKARPGEREAWRVEVWVNSAHWTRSGSGFFLWILSNFIYRSAGAGAQGATRRRGREGIGPPTA